MSPTATRRLAWTLAVVAAVITVAAAVVSLTGGDRLEVEKDFFIWAITLVFTVAGHVVATRQPRNPIGWIFLAGGVSAAMARLSGAYGDYWLDTEEGSRTLGQLAAVYGEVSWVPFVLVPATFLLLLFPDGRLLSRRWRPVAWCAVVGIAGLVVTTVLKPGGLEDHPDFANPYGTESNLRDARRGAGVPRTDDRAPGFGRLIGPEVPPGPRRAARADEVDRPGRCRCRSDDPG